MIEEREIHLDDKFEAMKEFNGWSEEGEKHALVVQQPEIKKEFQGTCGCCCGKYGHKAADCYERNLDQEKKNSESSFGPQNRTRMVVTNKENYVDAE